MMAALAGCTDPAQGTDNPMPDGTVTDLDAAMPGTDASADAGPEEWTGDVHGWTVHFAADIRPDRSAVGAHVLQQLTSDLGEVEDRLTNAQVTILQMTPIWVESDVPEYPSAAYFPADEPLEEEGYPSERREGILIGTAAEYDDYIAVQPAMILHELAHAWDDHYYQFKNQGLLDAYDAAKASGDYDSVPYVGGGNYRAYAMENAAEYFAELTEAWFWTNEYYPFNHDDLIAFDPEGAAAVESAWNP